MVRITPAYLEGLTGVNRIEFQMDETEDDVKVYLKVINDIVKACTGLDEINNNHDINQIPCTKPDPTSPVFVVHVYGTFDNVTLDHFLMADKEAVYVLAAKRQDGWYQVTNCGRAIEGARFFCFEGSYTEIPGGGLSTATKDLKLGFMALKRAIINVCVGNHSVMEFLNIALNLFEAAEYPYIRQLVVDTIPSYRTIALDSTHRRCKFLMNDWLTISSAVGECKEGNAWTLDGRVRDEQGDYVTFLTEDNAPEIVGMVKISS